MIVRKVSFLVLTLVVSLGFFGCSSLNEVVNTAGNIKSVSDSLPSSNNGNDATENLTSGSVDFKSGEVLCNSNGSADLMEGTYYLAKVLKAPTAATKNQAQVIYVNGGKTDWTNSVLTSRKATNADMEVGKVVFYFQNAIYGDCDQNTYRQAAWYLGRITNTDEMFKGLVEINGEKMFAKWIRVPDKTIE